MKRLGTSIPFSYYYCQNLWENYRGEVGESSKKAKKSVKACSKQAQRENVTPFCAICDETTKNMMGISFEPQKGKEEEDKREVVEENVVVIIDEDKGEEDKKEVVENKVVENGEVIEEEKREVVEKNVVENGKVVEDEKSEVVEKKVVENGEVKGEKGDEGGKIVIIDHNGIEFDALFDGKNNAAGEGGEGNGDGGMVEEKNEDLFPSDIFGECNLLSGWEEWKFEVEQKWEYNYSFWDTEDGAYSFWDVEAHANDWAESLWQF